MTGKGADVLQEEQKQQAMELEEMIAKRQEDDKIRELRKSGADAEADSLQKEQESRAAFVRDIAAKYGKATGVALGKVARTGSYDQSTAGYANIGLDAGKIQSDLKNFKMWNISRKLLFSYYLKFVKIYGVSTI